MFTSNAELNGESYEMYRNRIPFSKIKISTKYNIYIVYFTLRWLIFTGPSIIGEHYPKA